MRNVAPEIGNAGHAGHEPSNLGVLFDYRGGGAVLSPVIAFLTALGVASVVGFLKDAGVAAWLAIIVTLRRLFARSHRR